MLRRHSPLRSRRTPLAAALLMTGVLWAGCSDTPESPVGPAAPELASFSAVDRLQELDIQPALDALDRHGPELFAIQGVVGHGVGLGPDGTPTITVMTIQPGVAGIPSRLDGVPTQTVVTGRFVALTEETAKLRPAPLGVSIGHPDITAGTLGFKVKDGAGNPYILSNNHVMANSNNATVGDNILQPGPYDGGTDPADKIGTLADFVPISFNGGNNFVDAAIASVVSSDVLSSTPFDEGYGQPSSTTVPAVLNMEVQKYGRTTEHTTGTVSAINSTVNVCYAGMIFCTKLATFVDQIVITPGTFSAGGDSGSGIVTNDGNLNPVGLLFAGSDTHTIASPIDAVLSAFNVTIDDGGGSEPPPDLTDIEINNVSAPSNVTGGDVVEVIVAVRNAGNQDVAASFDVTLEDVTDAAVVGTQTVNGLDAGASTNLSFFWNTTGASFGDHVLVASHDFSDENGSNDQGSTTVEVRDPSAPTGIHVGDLDAIPSNEGTSWTAVVEVEVDLPDHQWVNGATVVGTWSAGAFFSDTCETGEGGGSGTCIFLNTLLPNSWPSVSFTVTSVTMAGETYDATQNHDDDGDSDGTTITVQNPQDPNDPPTANDVGTAGDEDTGPFAWTPDVSDPNGDPLTCSIVSQPPNGTATVSANCSGGTYTPDPDFNGADAFTYAASDGTASNQGTVDVTVNPLNDAPVATSDSYDAEVGSTLDVGAPGVLANDGDVDGDPLTAVLGTGPSNASAFTLNDDGSFSYTPGTEGADSFTYLASDGVLESSEVTVTIDVAASPPPPPPPPPGLAVVSVTPNSVQVGNAVEVTISGSGFAAGATITFENGNGPAPSASDVVFVDGSTITATIAARGGGPRRDRVWDLVVTNLDGSSAALAGGFTITP